MTRADALKKVKKLLDIAARASSNPNEAATAMRQAEALIRNFQITATETSGVAERAYLGRGAAVRFGLVGLHNVIAQLYGAECYSQIVAKNGALRYAYVFVSDKPGTLEICDYALLVLARQMDRDCRLHIKRVKKAANRGARGDAFCKGWVQGLRSALDLYSTDIVVSDAVKKHMEMLGAKARAVAARTSKAVSYSDAHSGFEKGKSAQLNKGVNQGRAALEAGL